MSSIELTAKSEQEAKKNAAAKLGVSEDQVEIEVLEQTKGLFGKVNLRVRATATVSAEPEVVAEATEAPVSDSKPAPKKKLGAKKETQKAEPEPEVVAEPVAVAAEKPAPKKKLGAKKDAPTVEVPATEAAPAAEAGSEESEKTEIEVVATEEDAATIEKIANELIAKSGLKVTVKTTGIQGKYVNLAIDGKDAAYMVGKHGEVINAMQYLLNLAVKQAMPNGVRCSLDGNDYRKRREQALTALATRIAQDVIERQEEAVLDALPAFERRVIHKALSEIEGVITYSEGEEPNRQVVIAPAE